MPVAVADVVVIVVLANCRQEPPFENSIPVSAKAVVHQPMYTNACLGAGCLGGGSTSGLGADRNADVGLL